MSHRQLPLSPWEVNSEAGLSWVLPFAIKRDLTMILFQPLLFKNGMSCYSLQIRFLKNLVSSTHKKGSWTHINWACTMCWESYIVHSLCLFFDINTFSDRCHHPYFNKTNWDLEHLGNFPQHHTNSWQICRDSLSIRSDPFIRLLGPNGLYSLGAISSLDLKVHLQQMGEKHIKG